MVHRLERTAEVVAAPRLDLDERHFASALHHQVDVAMSAAKAMRDDAPAMLLHPAGGDALAQQPESLSLSCHGRSVPRRRDRAVTKASRAMRSRRRYDRDIVALLASAHARIFAGCVHRHSVPSSRC
jgi:hypothetical protein